MVNLGTKHMQFVKKKPRVSRGDRGKWHSCITPRLHCQHWYILKYVASNTQRNIHVKKIGKFCFLRYHQIYSVALKCISSQKLLQPKTLRESLEHSIIYNHYTSLVFRITRPGVGGGGGHSLIWPIWVCATEQGMVFRVLSHKHVIQFHY